MKMQMKPKISLSLFPAVLLAFLAMGATSLVAQTPPNAGAVVTNGATVNYEIDDVPQPPQTAEEDFTIDALINPVVATTANIDVAPGQTGVVIPYTVTNGGNQTQDFVLDFANRGDVDVDTKDTVFGDAEGPATVDADEDGQHSATGTLTAGVVTVSITKTAAIIDNGLDDGSTDQFYIPGATVEYTITISYSGSISSNAGNIVMTDPIPAGTTYVAGSIDLNGDDTITDVDDTDAGDFGVTLGNAVTVAISGTRNGSSVDDVIKFRVTIDE